MLPTPVCSSGTQRSPLFAGLSPSDLQLCRLKFHSHPHTFRLAISVLFSWDLTWIWLSFHPASCRVTLIWRHRDWLWLIKQKTSSFKKIQVAHRYWEVQRSGINARFLGTALWITFQSLRRQTFLLTFWGYKTISSTSVPVLLGHSVVLAHRPAPLPSGVSASPQQLKKLTFLHEV